MLPQEDFHIVQLARPDRLVVGSLYLFTHWRKWGKKGHVSDLFELSLLVILAPTVGQLRRGDCQMDQITTLEHPSSTRAREEEGECGERRAEPKQVGPLHLDKATVNSAHRGGQVGPLVQQDCGT